MLMPLARGIMVLLFHSAKLREDKPHTDLWHPPPLTRNFQPINCDHLQPLTTKPTVRFHHLPHRADVRRFQVLFFTLPFFLQRLYFIENLQCVVYPLFCMHMQPPLKNMGSLTMYKQNERR